MKQSLVVGVLLVLPATAWAQHSHGYLFVAPGGISSAGHTSTSLHLGAGGEALLVKGIGIGAELGVVGPPKNFIDGVVGAASINGYYHFSRSGHKLDPFATAGYTLLFREGTANLFNFGGGANYWFIPRIGLKLEFRDHVYSPRSSEHYWGVRIGLAFR